MTASKYRHLPWLLVGILGTLWVTKPQTPSQTEQVTDQTPTILQALNKLGYLESAEMNLSEAFEYTTHKNPTSWASVIPGANELVQGATQNQVWIQANGTVVAGVDLTKAKIDVTADAITVTLPKVTVKRPDVDLKLMHGKRGVFWKDDEILLKATSVARDRFKDTATLLKLKKTAWTNAEEQVRKLVSQISPKTVVVNRA